MKTVQQIEITIVVETEETDADFAHRVRRGLPQGATLDKVVELVKREILQDGEEMAAGARVMHKTLGSYPRYQEGEEVVLSWNGYPGLNMNDSGRVGTVVETRPSGKILVRLTDGVKSLHPSQIHHMTETERKKREGK